LTENCIAGARQFFHNFFFFLFTRKTSPGSEKKTTFFLKFCRGIAIVKIIWPLCIFLRVFI
jgi:hypothetical protein